MERKITIERSNMNYFNTRHLIDYAQQTADAISSVLNLQVTIVDSDVRRVAGTGCFSLTLDKVLSPDVYKRQLSWFI